MKILKKIILVLGTLFLSFIILSVVLFMAIKHLKIKEIVERELEQELGVHVAIERLEFSPLLAHVGAIGVSVDNPPGFQEKELARLNYVHMLFDPWDLLVQKKPEIYVFAADLARLSIIKNIDGRVNIKEVGVLHRQESAQPDATPFSFDMIILSVGEVNYIEYSPAGKKEHKYTIGLKNQVFFNLHDEGEVLKLIVAKAIENTDIGKLINLTITPLVSHVSDTVSSAWGTAKLGARSAVDIATLPFKVLFGK
jgi:uncharacterized protein involved in outer membrane biogenesis